MTHWEYKRQNIGTWNEIAGRYHRRWAGQANGPWKSTDKLIRLAGIRRGDRVLDVACGTGIVARSLGERVGPGGLVVGLDTSPAALRIARRESRRAGNVWLVAGDAEKMGLAGSFDAVTCQYALFFFPNAYRALRGMRRSLKGGGVLGISVHGNNTPYYSSIADAMEKFIPDYLPAGSVRLDRFGTASSLRAEARKAGFSRIAVKEFVFSFSPGTFGQYWSKYRRYVSSSVREKLARLPRSDQLELRRQVRQNTLPYTRGGIIRFPWQVLILTARRP